VRTKTTKLGDAVTIPASMGKILARAEALVSGRLEWRLRRSLGDGGYWEVDAREVQMRSSPPRAVQS